jgi:hypothetical protein
MGPVGPRLAEVVVEDLPDHGSCLHGVGEEVVQLEHPRVILAPRAAGSAEGRDAALHADPRAGEGGEISGGADEVGGGTHLLVKVISGRRFLQGS